MVTLFLKTAQLYFKLVRLIAIISQLEWSTHIWWQKKTHTQKHTASPRHSNTRINWDKKRAFDRRLFTEHMVISDSCL